MSQESRLLKLLSDGAWHDTPGILEEVYGSGHLGICRIGARIFGLKKKGFLIESRKKHGTIWEYRLGRPFPVVPSVVFTPPTQHF